MFSSDALSSVAYATEEILMVLMLAGTVAFNFSIPISIAIISLLTIVVLSYRQTVHAYPNGGGAYIVARENLGELPGLTAAAALLIDYVLTVSVSIAAGIAALTSAFPHLHQHNQMLCILAILLVAVLNLRGVRESATIFAIPTYAFIIGIFVLLGAGFYGLANGTLAHADPKPLEHVQPLTLFLLLRAFSSGCTALTGVEAISNGVPVFKAPEPRNASITLVVMAAILALMFFGITFLSHYHGISALPNETVLSQLARSIFGTSTAYYFIQFTTMGILVLAANTSFTGFPRLASLLAQDRYLPRQLGSLGDRLVFSNGILILALLASVLIILFRASTHALIPLYAVGVFLSFTLSQIGMVRHWQNNRGSGSLRHIIINATGGVLTALVTVIFVLTKFMHGAWVILVLVPIFIWLFLKIQRHYVSVGLQLSLIGANPKDFEKPYHHIVLLPLSGIHRGVVAALQYGQSISQDVRAVYVELDPKSTERLQEDWRLWGRGVPLVVLKSPYRSVLRPILKYVDELDSQDPNEHITIIVPEFVPARWWQQLLHNQTALLLKAALTFRRGKVVTSVRYHLET